MRTHGMDATPTYRTWAAMKYRCLNPRSAKWADYGGRGITVCPQWRTFEGFFADMGVKPAGLTLDRRNNDGNYEPGNCRWATPAQQVANRRPSRAHRDSPIPVPGISWSAERRKYQVQLCIAGKQRSLGRFDDFFEACCARKSAEHRFSTAN